MQPVERRGVIEVWRPTELPELELRRGFGVSRPVPRHWHEQYQLCLIQSGSGDLVYRGDNLVTPPASLFIVHPGEVHSNRAHGSEGCSYRTIFADARLMRRAAAELGRKEAGPPFFPAAVVFDREAIRRYLEVHAAFEQAASSLERQAALLDLLTLLVGRFAEGRAAPRRFGAERLSVARARDYLVARYAENVSLEELARVANLSPFHFSRVFSEQMGMPPHAFQIQLRVERAKALLREGWPIPQVALSTGFADQSHLTRHFKRLAVVTPGQYARNSKNVQDSPAPLL
ncbi:MAG TPA: AraC family transcriptional regulator [Pyrinomonadaceae bacterium]|nr:AraC family transcriptional regulator [Pyrinomonadaceae bacterium]